MLREMQPGDHDRLIDLWSGFPGNALTGADGPEGFLRFLQGNGVFCFVAEEDEGLIGSVMAGTDGRRGYIYHLAVREECQGSGLGARLMHSCEDALRTAGIEKVHLFIFTDNPAVEFYEKIGWHRREDILVMSKVLIGDSLMGTRVTEGE